AIKPEIVKPTRPKILVFGAPGVGKTWQLLVWPRSYYIDTEGGANLRHDIRRMRESGRSYMGPDQGASDPQIVVEQIQGLATEKHDFKTLVIDSASKLWYMAITAEQERLGDKDQFGASKKPAVMALRRIIMWCERIDMNVVFVAHEKELWKNNKVEGFTFDCEP